MSNEQNNGGPSDDEIRRLVNLPFNQDENGTEWVTLTPQMLARAVRRALATTEPDQTAHTVALELVAQYAAERDQLRAQVERLQATEPFGYFRAEPMGWTDCAATDEGAIALYERPAAPAVPQGEPVALTDSYAGVIAWIGDKQCKLLVTEDAIKHEHTPGVVMRNTAHQCVQEVIIAALREKEARK